MFRITRIVALAAAAGATVALASCGTGPTMGNDEEVTLDFAFWGNDERAAGYEDVIDAFEAAHPGITVRSTFLTFAEFWEKRQTEAAGGGLPDVMQFSDRYLRQYGGNGLLLDLTPYLGDVIDDQALPADLLASGQLDDRTLAITASTNSWSLWTNPTLLERIGMSDFPGGTWDEYRAWLTEVSAAAAAAGERLWGSNDYSVWIQNFELQQRAKGEDLFSDDGKPNFAEDDLREFWGEAAPLREGVFVPQQVLEETLPLNGFDAALQAADVAWDSLGPGYLANLGEAFPEIHLQSPPIDDAGAEDLYRYPAMMLAASANTDHPDEAAELVDFLVNDPSTVDAFGLGRGVPASETALGDTVFDGIEQQILEHQASLGSRLGEAPPTPVEGFGSLQEKFRQIGMELNFGTVTVDEAVMQFFAEMDVVLNS